jgi:DNA-binding CsgD family transcriptional regulator
VAAQVTVVECFRPTVKEIAVPSKRDISPLIASIYDAGLDPDQWPAVLEGIARAIGGLPPVLWIGAPDSGPRADGFIGLDPVFARSYEQHYVDLDEIFWPVNVLAVGTVVTDAVVPRQALERSEFYHEWVRPLGMYSTAVAKFLEDGAFVGMISTPRHRRAPDVNRHHLETLALLLPHLRRAMLVQMRLGAILSRQGAVTDALDVLTHAILIVDAAAHVVFANAAGERLLERADGLGPGPTGLTAITPNLTGQLRSLIGRAAGSPGHRAGQADAASGSAIILERVSPKRPLQVLISPMRRETVWPGVRSGQAAAMLLVVDPDASPGTPEGRLMALYRLTRMEARIACHLGVGLTPAEAAAALGILLSTARTHLHHVYLKTGARRQSDLVRIVEWTTLVPAPLDGAAGGESPLLLHR